MVEFVAKFLDFPPQAVVALTRKSWVLFIDSSSCQAGKGIRMHLVSSEGQEYHYMAILTFKMANNEAKYEVLVVGLSIAMTFGTYTIKGEKLRKYPAWVLEACDWFSYFCISQIPHEYNIVADKLAHTTSRMEDAPLLWQVK